MQKKLALIEPHHHSEVLRIFGQLFLHLGWQIEVFTNAQVWKDSYELKENSSIKWHVQGEEKTTSFFQQQKPQIEKCELAIFVTLVADFPFFSQFQLKPKTILIIHNGNTFFDPSTNWHLAATFPEGLKDIGRLLRIFFKQENKYRRRLLTAFDYLSMAGQTMSSYFAERENLIANYSFVPPLPFVFYEGNPKKTLLEKESVQSSVSAGWNSLQGQGAEEEMAPNFAYPLEIAIPGVLKGEGKDYEKVWKAFVEVVPQLSQAVRLNFLGSARSKYAQEIIRRFQQLENNRFSIQYSMDLIPQKNFDQYLSQADFLIIPLKKSYRLGGIREVYGHTNISGGINDLIRFGIPALISPDYPLEPPLERMTQRYDTAEDLRDILLTWIKQRSFEAIRKQAPQILAPYRIENQAVAVAKWLKEIC